MVPYFSPEDVAEAVEPEDVAEAVERAEKHASSGKAGGAGEKRARRRCSGRPKRSRRARHSAREDVVAGDEGRAKVYNSATGSVRVKWRWRRI